MQTYCLNCKKHTDNIGPKIFKVKNGRPILLSLNGEFLQKKIRKEWTFIRDLYSSLGIKTPLSKIPLLGNILFWFRFDIKRMR